MTFTVNDPDTGKPQFLANVSQDITERKRAEEKLISAKLLSEEYINSLPGLFYVFDEQRFVRWNREWERVTGYNEEELASRYGTDFFEGEDRTLIGERMLKVFREGAADAEAELVTKGGQRIPYYFTGLRKELNGKPHLVGLGIDITERRQAEEALRESEEKFRKFIEDAPVGMYLLDLEGRFVYGNKKLTEITGYEREEWLGKEYDSVVYPDDLPIVLGKIRQGMEGQKTRAAYEIRIFQASGTVLWVSLTSENIYELQHDGTEKLLGFQTFVQDITDRKRAEENKAKLEEQLRQAQKMESIGTLAGGIAHDFNNILGIIVGNTELAINDIPEWNPARPNLEEVRNACLRARDMVKQILSFSRKTEQEAKPIRISPLMEESLKLIRSSIPSTIEIRKDFSASADTILGDPTQINQILMNLCTNAAHAMREEGGILTVRLKNMDLDEDTATRNHELTPGKYLTLAVSDTGQGMEPELIDRIFDPYFTTKEVGEGTGMGLAVVHGIVKNHHGAVHVYSEPGKGTTLNVYFPLIKSETLPESTVLAPLPTGTDRILFVDDEEALAELGKRMLQRLGYEVTVRTSSMEALEVFREQPDKFDLVVTDMTMPNMTGIDLCKELLQIRVDIPIILCTGFSEMITEEKSKQIGIKAFMMKPLVMREIAEAVRRVLDQEKE